MKESAWWCRRWLGVVVGEERKEEGREGERGGKARKKGEVVRIDRRARAPSKKERKVADLEFGSPSFSFGAGNSLCPPVTRSFRFYSSWFRSFRSVPVVPFVPVVVPFGPVPVRSAGLFFP